MDDLVQSVTLSSGMEAFQEKALLSTSKIKPYVDRVFCHFLDVFSPFFGFPLKNE